MSQPRPPFRCAIVSAAKHDYVARGVATHPRFELAVVTDDPAVPAWMHERNQGLADSLNIPYVRDLDAALGQYGAEVAIVSSEAERHCELSRRAAAAGLHVIQDKPLATRRADVEALRETLAATGRRFLMWNRNFIPAIVDARRQVADGRIGRPRAVHVDFYFAKDAGPPKGSRTAGYPPLNWLAHQTAAHIDGSDGGLGQAALGELAIEGIYPLGYIRMITGAEVRRVFARGSAHFHQLYADNHVEDLASVTLEMDSGALGSIAVGRIGAASHASGGEIKLRIVGDQGALVIHEALPHVGVYYRNQPPKEPRQRRVAIENDFLLADDFACAIDEGRPSVLDIDASIAIYATFEAALTSCRTGRKVTVS